MRRWTNAISVLALASMLTVAVPAGATTPGYEERQESSDADLLATGLDDLISVDSVTGEIYPLGIQDPGTVDAEIGITGVTEGNSTYSGMSVLWGGYLGGSYGTDILMYDRSDGYFEFRSVGSDGMTYQFWESFGTTGWSQVVPGDYDGNGITDLLFYRSRDGLMRFYTIEPDGTFRAMTPAMFGTRGWTAMVPGDYDNDGSDDLMWYRARDGIMRFYSVDAPRFVPMTDAAYGTQNWSIIPSGDFDGDGSDDLMYYRAGDGLYRFYTLTGAGRFTPISSVNYTDRYWDQIMSGQFDEFVGDDLVFYKPELITAKGFDPDYLYSITNDGGAPYDQLLTVLDWNPFN